MHPFNSRSTFGRAADPPIGSAARTPNAQSIVKAMEEFTAAVQHMRGVVMVPNRLKDLEISVPAELPTGPPKSLSSSGPSSLALPSSGPSSLALPASGPSSLALARAPLRPAVPTTEVDLFTFYQTLDSIHQELLCGSEPSLDEAPSSIASSLAWRNGETTDDDSSNSDGASSVDSDEYRIDHSRRITEAFRQHLSGLFSVLHQLTETANVLSERYQDEVAGNL